MKHAFKTAITSAIMLLGLAAEIAAQAGGNWPQWRGPNRDGISTETGLLKQWPASGPPLVGKLPALEPATLHSQLSTANLYDGRAR